MNNLLQEEEEEEKEKGVIRGVNNVILPTILIFEILLLLPVRILLRFRCVCKEWCELIDSRVFKDTYNLALRRRRAIAVDDRLFILKGIPLRCWYGDFQSLVALASAVPVIPPSSSSSSSSSCSASNEFFEIPGEWSALPRVNIMNHVDGIICLFHHGDYSLASVCFKPGISFNWLAITLVNPALREFRKVPFPPEFDLLGDDIFKRSIQGIGIGFSSNNEYKVVALVTVFEKERDGYGSPYKHIGIVYHLTTNSWTILGDFSEFDVSCKCFCHQESVFSHGSLHWCIKSDDEMKKHQILAFDVTNESFRKIGMFPHANITSHRLLTVDKSTIAFVESITLNVFDSAIQIWVMNEYGNSDSWTKRWFITNLQGFAETLCFLDQDKILIDLRNEGLSLDEILLDLRFGGLCTYDLSKGRLQSGTYRPLVSWHESFVSIKQF